MFSELEKINSRPKPFEFYTAQDLWTDDYTSEQMLHYHLNEKVDLASRNSAFIDRSVEWIVSHFKIRPAARVADFGCGPGLYTTRLAKYHTTVTGIDFSRSSIEYARQTAKNKGLEIHYVHQNYLEFETSNRFDLILMIMCDFCVLNPAQRKTILKKFHSLLEPGGAILLDVNSLNAFQQREETATYQANLLNGFFSPNQYYGFLNTFKYEQEKVILDKYTIIEESRTQTIYNWFQHFSPESLQKEFSDCGLTIESIYADVAGAPYDPDKNEFAVIAVKQ